MMEMRAWNLTNERGARETRDQESDTGRRKRKRGRETTGQNKKGKSKVQERRRRTKRRNTTIRSTKAFLNKKWNGKGEKQRKGT